MSEDDVEQTDNNENDEEDNSVRQLQNMNISNLKFKKIFSLLRQLIESKFDEEYVEGVKDKYGEDAIPWTTDLPLHHKGDVILNVEAIKVDVNEQNRGLQPVNERGKIFASIEVKGDNMKRMSNEYYKDSQE
jgi:hypothetical protein